MGRPPRDREGEAQRSSETIEAFFAGRGKVRSLAMPPAGRRKGRKMSAAPHGSPQAGPVRVYRLMPDGSRGELLRVEQPLPSKLTSGTTLPGGPGQAWVSGGTDGVAFEGGTDTR